MPSLLACDNCGFSLLGFESRGPVPIDHDACPECGMEEFSFVTDAGDVSDDTA